MMRRLKQIIPTLLMLAASGVVLATLFSDHGSDYGSVPLPPGGTVELPEGTVRVYYDEAGQASDKQLAAPLSFEVTPAVGGPPIDEKPAAKAGTSETEVQRSEDLLSKGSVATLDVPAAGRYLVRGNSESPVAGAALTFGTDPLTAVARRWELLAGLIGAAVLIALIPLPRRARRHGGAEDTSEWSSDPRVPYA